MYNKKNPKKAIQYLIQGDVCAKRIEALPANAKPAKDRIVAHGEITGHHHILEAGQVFTDDTGNLFALIDKPVKLFHQEHAPWILEPGIWQFGKDGMMQVEYDGEEERAALD